MISLIVTAITNILLNYYMIFILELGVKGAAFATVLSAVISFLVLLVHFFKKDITLKFVLFKWALNPMKRIFQSAFQAFS